MQDLRTREEETLNIKNCERKENNEAEIVVEVNAQEFEAALDKAFIKNRNKMAVPGFRKGKAPRKIIENAYGASVFHGDAVDVLIPDVIIAVAEQSELRIVGLPQVTDVDIKGGNACIDFTVYVSLYPEVIIGEYRGLSAPKPAVEVPEAEVDSEVDRIRLRNARIEKADRPAQSGDIVVIDYEGFMGGEPFQGGKNENYELELGSGRFVPGFEDQIEGMVAGEEGEISIVFPEGYVEHLAGRAAVFEVKLHEVKEKILPDLDDEFAKDVSEFDTLDEYKSDIRERLRKSKQDEADVAYENALMAKLAGKIEADVPIAMVEEQMDHAMEDFAKQVASYGMDIEAYLKMMNKTPQAFREDSRKSSERQVRVFLALEKIAELEGIEVSEEEIENAFIENADLYGTDIDKLKETTDSKDVAREIKMRRAAKIVVESAVNEEAIAEGEEAIADDEEVIAEDEEAIAEEEK